MIDLSEWIRTGMTVSAVISFAALVVSIIALVNTHHQVKTERKISEERYNEQKRQYEDRIDELKKQRDQDKREAEEKLRISEQPYFVYEGFRRKTPYRDGENDYVLSFKNKGRGSAFHILTESMGKSTQSYERLDEMLFKSKPKLSSVAMVGETIESEFVYFGNTKAKICVYVGMHFYDASGREYQQTHIIDISNCEVVKVQLFNPPRQESWDPKNK